ncbi:hypothetical protein ACJX0J_005800, partial [Zea mays]
IKYPYSIFTFLKKRNHDLVIEENISCIMHANKLINNNKAKAIAAVDEGELRATITACGKLFLAFSFIEGTGGVKKRGKERIATFQPSYNPYSKVDAQHAQGEIYYKWLGKKMNVCPKCFIGSTSLEKKGWLDKMNRSWDLNQTTITWQPSITCLIRKIVFVYFAYLLRTFSIITAGRAAVQEIFFDEKR